MSRTSSSICLARVLLIVVGIWIAPSIAFACGTCVDAAATVALPTIPTVRSLLFAFVLLSLALRIPFRRHSFRLRRVPFYLGGGAYTVGSLCTGGSFIGGFASLAPFLLAGVVVRIIQCVRLPDRSVREIAAVSSGALSTLCIGGSVAYGHLVRDEPERLFASLGAHRAAATAAHERILEVGVDRAALVSALRAESPVQSDAARTVRLLQIAGAEEERGATAAIDDLVAETSSCRVFAAGLSALSTLAPERARFQASHSLERSRRFTPDPSCDAAAVATAALQANERAVMHPDQRGHSANR